MRDKIMQLLDDPTTRGGRIVSLTMLILIYLSVAQVIIEMRYHEFAVQHSQVFHALESLVLAVFTVELVLRLVFSRRRAQYLRSFYGLIDVLAVAPGLAGLLLPIRSETAWLRVFRILRFARVSKAIRSGSILGGIRGRLTPYLAMVLGLKGIMVALEGEPWWPEIGNLSVVISVVGFALAILLGTKLRIVSNRYYALEDAVCRIVGSLRDLQANPDVRARARAWATRFEAVLTEPSAALVQEIRDETDEFERELEAAAIGGPNTAWFHRDVEFVLHRALTRTPEVFDNFLRNITIAYTATVIIAIPGLTGFLSSILVTYVLGGVFLIIDDMDQPLDYGAESFIDISLDPLSRFNRSSYGSLPSTSVTSHEPQSEFLPL
jgi:hypothetical protein